MCDSRTDTKTGLLPVNEVRSLLDVCWKAKAITELMPALPKGLKPRYVHVIVPSGIQRKRMGKKSAPHG